jgi:hypothetical protein
MQLGQLVQAQKDGIINELQFTAAVIKLYEEKKSF